jgi:hypothetical protein
VGFRTVTSFTSDYALFIVYRSNRRLVQELTISNNRTLTEISQLPVFKRSFSLDALYLPLPETPSGAVEASCRGAFNTALSGAALTAWISPPAPPEQMHQAALAWLSR